MVFSFLGGGREPAGAQQVRTKTVTEVRAYWEGLRSGGRIPARSDLDPRGMARALDHVFVAERIGTGLVRLRIAGMALTDLAGLDMKGLPLSTLFLPEARLRLAEVLERVFTLPSAADLHLEAERSIGRPALSARLLLLPLHSNGGARDLILGCLATEGEVGRAPRRFGIARAVEERLILPQAPEPMMAHEMEPPAFADPAAPPPRPLSGKPHLRLVHSAD
jgi:hypothetical protein